MPRDRAGETLKSAKTLGVLTAKSTSLAESVSRLDRYDLYQFKLGDRSSVTLKLAQLSKGDRIGIRIFQPKDAQALRAIRKTDLGKLKKKDRKKALNAVASTQFNGNKSPDLSLSLEAGDYYLQVSPKNKTAVSSPTAYRLTLSAKATPKKNVKPPVVPTQPSVVITPPYLPPQIAPTWIKQFPKTNHDYAYGVATDAVGNIYMAGVNSAEKNSFVTMTAADGTVLWQRQLNIPGSDTAYSIAVDGDGNYYVAGAANVTTKSSEGFVAKYSADGTELWRQAITTSVPNTTSVASAASDIALDSAGHIYVSGFLGIAPTAQQAGNAFVAQYDGSTGQLMADFGTAGIVQYGGSLADAASSIAVDADGRLYITGITNATLTTNLRKPYAEGDAFVACLTSTGTLAWSQTLGDSGQDYGRNLALDGLGNVYITGQTVGTLPSGSLPANTKAGASTDIDVFVAKYSTSSGLQWVKQLGTSSTDEAQAIATDSLGRLYVAGETRKALMGGTPLGGSDSWVAQLDGSGQVLKSSQFGTPKDEEPYGMALDSRGNLYVAGQTIGSLGGATNLDNKYDVWLAQYANSLFA